MCSAIDTPAKRPRPGACRLIVRCLLGFEFWSIFFILNFIRGRLLGLWSGPFQTKVQVVLRNLAEISRETKELISQYAEPPTHSRVEQVGRHQSPGKYERLAGFLLLQSNGCALDEVKRKRHSDKSPRMWKMRKDFYSCSTPKTQ